MQKEIEINDEIYLTFATLDEADRYFNARFGSEWGDIEELSKKQLLVTATQAINLLDFAGVKVDNEQPLNLPRFINDVETDEQIVINATCEQALSMYVSPKMGGTDILSALAGWKLGDVQATFKKDAVIETELVNEISLNFLRPYLKGNARVIW